MYKYFPHTEADISEMLGKIGLSSLDELYAEIPENIRFDKDYDLKKSMSEDEVRNYFRELGKTNKKLIPFAGGSAYDHYAPAVSANSSSFNNSGSSSSLSLISTTIPLMGDNRSLAAFTLSTAPNSSP